MVKPKLNEKPVIKLSAEVQCHPLWLKKVGVGEIFENLDSESLGLTVDLNILGHDYINYGYPTIKIS